MKEGESFYIDGLGGQRTLYGEIAVGGAKNQALKMFVAALLFEDEVRIKNVPDIEDVRRMVELIEVIGVEVIREAHDTYRLKRGDDISTTLPRALLQQFRAGVIAIGPLLAQYGRVTFYSPGGCRIGTRPIDISIVGLGELGASIEYELEDDCLLYDITTASGGLRGGDVVLRIQSVSATELLMMAATKAHGITTIHNAAMEPEIIALADFLNECGAKIEGVGTPTITITGGNDLRARGRTCHIIPDRIEAGTFAILGALSARELTITNCNPSHLRVPLELLRTVGVPLECHDDRIVVRTPNRDIASQLLIKTHEYPGFPTDLQPQMVLFFTQVQGINTLFETIYESRFEYLDSLREMGADIVLSTNHAIISGPTPLMGIEMPAIDLRAGMAFVLAAIVAEGGSVVHNVYNIRRGYEAIDKRLQNIGVSIERR